MLSWHYFTHKVRSSLYILLWKKEILLKSSIPPTSLSSISLKMDSALCCWRPPEVEISMNFRAGEIQVQILT